ncbi:MAG: hypothetical protein U5K69_03215 [Balneolaceae bacterium]|nr:hypothetical protein [Balneolaceae bacterium]
MDDQFVEDYQYDVVGTPCEVFLGKKDMLHIPKNVINLFPNDPDLQKFSALSYLVIPDGLCPWRRLNGVTFSIWG